MRKCIIGSLVICAISAAMSITAFAGTWKSDSTGWWYDNGNGSYPANCWQWIDGNNDGNAESYYFNPSGYCLMNTTTPDGYTVNENGAWVVNGLVQTKQINANNQSQQQNSSVEPLILFSNKPTQKYFADYLSLARSKVDGQLSNVIRLSQVYDGYTEYYAGGKYTQFTASLYAPETLSSSPEYTLEVYGDDDNMLYESDTLNYKTSNEPVTVDITGQQYVRIVCHQTEHAADGNAGIYLKNAQFK